MNGQLSDALVLFGATGDLAHKKSCSARPEISRTRRSIRRCSN